MTTLYPTKGKVLQVDGKWSISYDPDNNDRPLKLFRYGEETGVNMHNEKNYVLAMFYRILELEDEVKSFVAYVEVLEGQIDGLIEC